MSATGRVLFFVSAIAITVATALALRWLALAAWLVLWAGAVLQDRHLRR